MEKFELVIERGDRNYFWTLYPTAKKPLVDEIPACRGYTTEAAAKRSAKTWAKKHNIEIIEKL